MTFTSGEEKEIMNAFRMIADHFYTNDDETDEDIEVFAITEDNIIEFVGDVLEALDR